MFELVLKIVMKLFSFRNRYTLSCVCLSIQTNNHMKANTDEKLLDY